MTTKPDDLLALLSSHIGRRNGIRARDAARALRCLERDIRHGVTTLRMDGRLVCGEPASGYFIPETVEEGLSTIAYLRGRAMTTLVILQKMERALIELSGQARLPT